MKLVRDLVDTGNLPSRMAFDQPVPEGWAEIETVMQIAGLNEDVRVEQISGQSTTPTSRPIWLNVAVFETPNMRNASR